MWELKTLVNSEEAFWHYRNLEKTFGESWSISKQEPKPYRFIHHLGAGLLYEFPLCCILRFSYDVCKGRLPGKLRGSFKHKKKDGSFGACVPCGIFHKKD